MDLTSEEQKILNGGHGAACRKAMEIVVALGNIYGAQRLIPIGGVQVAGVSYKNLGEAGLDFLSQWAGEGARVCCPTLLNPAGIDLERWEEFGFDADFAAGQLRVIECFRRFDIAPVCTCTPYLVGSVPRFGEHIAWAESSAVSFANSVLGARTNREGGPSALAAAIIGKTAAYGLHLDKNRRANYVVNVDCAIADEADYGALGYLVGKMVQDAIPFFRGLQAPSLDQLKMLGAAMAASGAVALYHIEGVTPEARICGSQRMICDDAQTITITDLQEAYAALNCAPDEIDTVTVGCPHASYPELKRIAELLQGKKIKTRLWITLAMPLYHFARRAGLADIIEKAGAKMFCDTCLIVAPTENFGVRNLATNSAKAACYAPHHCKVKVRYGNLEKCIQAALQGRFTS